MSSAELRVMQRRGTVALAGREVRRVLSLWTQTILLPVITALLFLVIFGGALGGRIHRIEGIRYLAFILPGLLVMTIASQATANSATSLFQAKNEGYIEDVLTSPLRPWQIVGSYVAGSILRAFAAALIVAGIAAPFAGGVDNVALAVAALVLTGMIFSSLGVITGVWADTFDQQSFVASIVITPLARSSPASARHARSDSRCQRSRASTRSTTSSMRPGPASPASTRARSCCR
jgi:ABC-2 type transport system permease protein